MSSPLKDVETTLPKYLSPESADELAAAIKRFPDQIQYYAAEPHAGMWQGDVYNGIQAVRRTPTTVEFRRGVGMAIGNTCDMASENTRLTEVRVCLAGVTTRSKFEALLLSNGVTKERLAPIVEAIRLQRKTNIFFLPRGGGGPSEDLLVFLDDIHSQNIEHFRDDSNVARAFSLSNVGWYLLLVKLAIHFCRAFEGEERSRSAPVDPPVSSSAMPAVSILNKLRTWFHG